MRGISNTLNVCLIEQLQNHSIKIAEALFDGNFKDPGNIPWQNELKVFSEQDRELIISLINYCTVCGINNFLYSKELRAALDLNESIASEYHKMRYELAIIKGVYPPE